MLRPIVILSSVIALTGSCKKSGAGEENATRADGTGGGGTTQTPEESYAEAYYLLDAGIRAGAVQGMGSPIVLTFDSVAGPKSCVAQRLRDGSPVLVLSVKCPFDEKVALASINYFVEDKNGQPPRAMKVNIAAPQGDQVCAGPNEFKAIEASKVANLVPGLREVAAAGGNSFVNFTTGAAYVAGRDAKFLAPGLESCSDRKSGFDGAVVSAPPPKDAAFILAWKGVMEYEGISRKFLGDTRNAFFYELFLPSVGSKNKTVDDPLIRPADEGEDNAKRAVEELLSRELKTSVVARGSLFPISYPVRGTDQSCLGFGLEVKKLIDAESVGFVLVDGGGKDRAGGKKAFEIRDWKMTLSGVSATTHQKTYAHLPFVVGLFANQLESDSAVSLSPAVRATPEAVPGVLECIADPAEPTCEVMRGAEVAGPTACPKLILL